MSIICIDVSKYQGDIDWAEVKRSGVEIAIIKAGYGRLVSQKDEKFEQNYAGAKAQGIKVGVYWYSYAMSKNEALLEAKACLEVIKGKQFEYPIYFDLEEQKQFKLGKKACSEMISTFCNKLEEQGYYAGLYMSRSHLENYVEPSVRNRYTLWIAEYTGKCNYYGQYGMWQYSSTGRIAGIKGNVDTNKVYFDPTQNIKSNGLNGFKVSSVKVKTKTVAELAQEVLNGKWGNGDERRKRLTQAGYDYNAVQSKVNKLTKNKKSVVDYNKIAKEVIQGKWGNGNERRKRLTQAGYDYNIIQKKVNELLK